MGLKNLTANAPGRTNVAKTSGAVTAGAASVTVAAANPARVEITVVNDHATQIAYLALNTTDGTTVPTATLNTGIRLAPVGGSWTSSAYSGPVAAIATGATTVLTVVDI